MDSPSAQILREQEQHSMDTDTNTTRMTRERKPSSKLRAIEADLPSKPTTLLHQHFRNTFSTHNNMAPATTSERATQVATATLKKAAPNLTSSKTASKGKATATTTNKAASKSTNAAAKAKNTTAAGPSTKTAANTSKKRKVDSTADETEEEEEGMAPAKKRRGAPKKETAATSKKAVASSSKPKSTTSSKSKSTASSSKSTAASRTKANASKSSTNTNTKASASTSKKAATKAQVNGSASSSRKRKNDDEDSEQEENQRPTKKPRAIPEKKPVAKPKKIVNSAPDKKMNVYVFGEGSAGELGLGSAKGVTDVKRPRLNALLSAEIVGVVQIATGGMHAIALTHDNKILTWGVNDQGALGRDTTWDGGLKDVDANDSDSDASDSGLNPAESTPTAIPSTDFPEGTVFVQVAAGDSISMALTDDGFVYGWGTFRSNEGILGFSATSKIQRTPALVPGLKNITSLACGDNHVLALTDKGAVFAFGSGQQNQLGRRVVERTSMNGLTPREFGLPKNKITYVTCGAYHSFAIDKSGKVWTWGLNSYGETGIDDGAGDDKAIIFKPMEVKALTGKGVTCMAGGGHHSLAATEQGECLVWGRCDGSQTGLELNNINSNSLIKDESGKSRILMAPTPIPNLGKVVHVAAGTDHSIAIAEDGKAYSWGFSGTYQTGQGTTDDIAVATHIDNTAVRGKQLVWAGAGGQFSVLASYA